MLGGMLGARDRRRWGGSFFEDPAEHAGAPLLDRFLGVRDLVGQFDGERKTVEVRWRRAEVEEEGGGGGGASSEAQWFVKRVRGRGWKYGWPMALMEMLVDPVLSLWVPSWVVEQYKRWNPKFGAFLEKALAEDVRGLKSNRAILARVWGWLERDLKRAAARKEAEAARGREAVGEGDEGAELAPVQSHEADRCIPPWQQDRGHWCGV